jgi:pyruvate dehydrogenase E2 component (dihydrolipoamide acetyltransferase)
MPEERDVRMPALTTTMEEAELVEWKVAIGDHVHEGQALGEVVTDKVDMELESPFDGTITALLANEGAVVKVGATVARVETETDDLLGGLGLHGEDAPADEPPPALEAPPERESGAGPPTDGGRTRVAAPPPVRIRARDADIDLADVPATGRRGQVTTEDLRRYMEDRPTTPAKPAGLDRRKAALRAATARVVTRSAGIPQFTLHRAIDLGRAVEHKQGRSWTTEVVRALAAALRQHPDLNAHWNTEAERVDPIDTVRIGLAVAVPAGLLVVGMTDPDQLRPNHTDEHVREIVSRARDGALESGDVEGITFTVSNLGGLGVDSFEALLMPPQAGILSVGRVVERPVVIEGRIRPRLQVDVGLTVDHRVADGADAARLLQTFANILEGN